MAVQLPPSRALPLALLGVWRTGAAVVPLDPDAPLEHLRSIQQHTKLDAVLTHERWAAALRGENTRVIALDTERDALRSRPATAPDVVVEPEDLAWVTYGPDARDGLMTDHATVANHVRWTVRRYGVSASDRVLHLGSAGPAYWPVFTALLGGATSVMASSDLLDDPTRLVPAVAADRVTVLPVTPATLEAATAGGDWRTCSDLRTVLATGSVLDAELGGRVTVGTDLELWQVYGPDGGSLAVTAQSFEARQASGTVPLGRPVDNVRVLVLDEYGDPSPPGVPGELHVAGLGVRAAERGHRLPVPRTGQGPADVRTPPMRPAVRRHRRVPRGASDARRRARRGSRSHDERGLPGHPDRSALTAVRRMTV